MLKVCYELLCSMQWIQRKQKFKCSITLKEMNNLGNTHSISSTQLWVINYEERGIRFLIYILIRTP